MPLIYKTLFEVKLMHEFFLTSEAGDVVFDLPAQSQRIQFLRDRFSLGKPSVNDVLEFRFPTELADLYEDYQLKLLSTYSGFKVAVRVNPSVLPDGTLVYEPFVPFSADAGLFIQAVKKTSFIEQISNRNLFDPLPRTFIFSNEDVSGAKDFPFLTNAISAHDASAEYAQGDIASFGAADTRRFYAVNGAPEWEPIPGSAFASENDRILVPLQFYYSFPPPGVPEAVFELEDSDGSVVKTITVSREENFRKTFLDFEEVAKPVPSSGPFSFVDHLYQLKVTAPDGYNKIHPVLFQQFKQQEESWALIHLLPRVANPAFQFIDDEGFLIKRKVPPGVWTEAPVFEIAVLSRFAFRRYIHNRGKELKLIASLTDYLFKEDKVILSRKPGALTDSFLLFNNNDNTDTTYLPAPANFELKQDKKERLCLDVMVPESALFPLE